ncbi:hypothetical protein ABZ646_00225 [Streptomyces sp. NPDC007162]|uniref:hypothetical protein n=1 Tax=Streptomyces sp. NPDC007162 TaxID=3156917 RepID=UPI003403CA10
MPEGLAQWGYELFLRREAARRRGPAPENHAGKDIAQRGFEPCLLALLRLSVGTDPGPGLTTGWFPAALVRTGHLVRAAELAWTIGDELERSRQLLALVKAAADAGDLYGAQALAESVPLPQLRDEALVALVPAWARAGERDLATALAEGIRYPHNWARAWAVLARAVADDGDIQDALGFVGRADDEARAFVFDGTGEVLVLLMEAAAATGDQERAAALADRVEDFTRSHTRAAWSKSRPLAAVLAREALSGDLDRLDTLLRTPSRPSAAGDVLCGWALDAAADQGGAQADQGGAGDDQGGAEDVVQDLTRDVGQGAPREGEFDEFSPRPLPPRPFLTAWELAWVLDAVAEAADLDVALALADRAEALLESGGAGRDHDHLLRAVTLLLARRGQAERAMALADRIDADLRAGRQAEIVGELARSGDTDTAESLAHAITDPRARARALIEVVRELARRGAPDAAETVANLIDDRWAQDEALVAVVQGRARRGDPDRAETLAHSIAHRATRARALAALAEVSEPSRARRLAAQVVVLGGWDAALPVLERIVPRSTAVVVDQMMIRDGL